MYQVINIRTITSFAQILYVFHVSADIYKYQLFLLHRLGQTVPEQIYIVITSFSGIYIETVQDRGSVLGKLVGVNTNCVG